MALPAGPLWRSLTSHVWMWRIDTRKQTGPFRPSAADPENDTRGRLKAGARMVISIGQPFKRGQVLYVYTKDAAGKVYSRRDMGVFFIPMTGAISSSKPVATRL